MPTFSSYSPADSSRLERLESQLRRLYALTALSIAGFVVLLLWLLLPTPILIANRFELRDALGAPRAALELREANQAALRLNDGRGKARAMLSVDGEGTSEFRLWSPQGENRLSLALDGDGAPSVLLRDDSGRVRTRLAVSNPGSPAVAVRSASGQTIWSAP